MNFPESPLTDEASDGELLAAMVAGDEAGLAAFEIFYSRYVEDLYKYIYRVKGLLEADRRDLVQEAMLKAYHSAATFKRNEIADSDAEKNRRQTVAWLGQIAARIHYQKFRRQNGAKFEVLEEENRDSEKTELASDKIPKGERGLRIRESEEKFLQALSSNGQVESVPRKILQEVLDKLPERECEILLATYEEFDLQNPKKQLSREKINEIKERYNISSENLKQIRYRAKKFVFEECLKKFESSQAEIKI